MQRQPYFNPVYVSRSVMSDSTTPWTVAHQAPLSMEFFRQEYRVDSHSHFHRIFLTQASNVHLLYYRQTLYHLSHQGSPFNPILKHNCSHNCMQKNRKCYRYYWMRTDLITSPLQNAFSLGHKSLFCWFLFHHALLSPHSHSCQVLGLGCYFSLLLGHKEHLWKAEECIILFWWHTAFYRVPKPTLKWLCISSSGTEREWPNQVGSSRVGHQLK